MVCSIKDYSKHSLKKMLCYVTKLLGPLALTCPHITNLLTITCIFDVWWCLAPDVLGIITYTPLPFAFDYGAEASFIMSQWREVRPSCLYFSEYDQWFGSVSQSFTYLSAQKQHRLSITAHKISVHFMLFKGRKKTHTHTHTDTHLSWRKKGQREIGQAVQSSHYTATSTTQSTDDCKCITPSSLRSPWWTRWRLTGSESPLSKPELWSEAVILTLLPLKPSLPNFT